jgi:hypothetical protein
MLDFKAVHFVHVPREKNTRADAAVNEALDNTLKQEKIFLKTMRLPVFKPLYFFLKALGVATEWEVSVGAVVFTGEKNKRQYLLLHYPSGHFDFPKGHVEVGETEEETLRRENGGRNRYYRACSFSQTYQHPLFLHRPWPGTRET